jgi:hypothetical protein
MKTILNRKKPPVFSEMIKIDVSFSYLDNDVALFVKDNSYYKIKDLKCKEYNKNRFIIGSKQKTHTILIDLATKAIDYSSICDIIK